MYLFCLLEVDADNMLQHFPVYSLLASSHGTSLEPGQLSQ